MEVQRVLREALDDHGHSLAAAHAHRLESDRLAGVLEGVEQRGHDAGTGLSEWMAEGKSIKEIAALLHSSVPEVRRLAKKGRDKRQP